MFSVPQLRFFNKEHHVQLRVCASCNFSLVLSSGATRLSSALLNCILFVSCCLFSCPLPAIPRRRSPCHAKTLPFLRRQLRRMSLWTLRGSPDPFSASRTDPMLFADPPLLSGRSSRFRVPCPFVDDNEKLISQLPEAGRGRVVDGQQRWLREEYCGRRDSIAGSADDEDASALSFLPDVRRRTKSERRA